MNGLTAKQRDRLRYLTIKDEQNVGDSTHEN